MLDRFLDNKRNLYAMALVAIVFESLSSSVLKVGGQYPFLSPMYLLFFGLALVIMATYAVAWQLLLERAASDHRLSAEGTDLCPDFHLGGGVLRRGDYAEADHRHGGDYCGNGGEHVR